MKKIPSVAAAAGLLAYLLLFCSTAMAISEYTGWWWEGAEKSGTGVSIEDQGDRIYLAWYGYDETGRPVWNSALIAQSGSEYAGDLVRYAGWPLDGNLPGQGYQGTVVGSLSLAFSSPETAQLSYTIAGTGYSKTLSRYWTGAADPRDIHGWWWDPDFPGMGIFMEARGGQLFASWYHYRGDQSPRWWISIGDFPGQATGYSAPLYEYASGQTITGGYELPEFNGEQGAVDFQFVSETQAEMAWQGRSYDLHRFLFTGQGAPVFENGLIIDHNCTDASQIPAIWLEAAKRLALHYAHTSHGGQIIEGAANLESQDSRFSIAVNESSSPGLPEEEDPPALRIYDGNPGDTYVTPELYWRDGDGRDRTRQVASTGDYDFSMWAWCGQVSEYSQADIQAYLDTLAAFEAEYPAMRFIYMTGHLDGSGSAGTLHQNNETIRNYCRTHGKVLFDFADIERYNPGGQDFLDQGANDNCHYDEGNWAQQWCSANPGSELCAECSCAHSQALNCNRKARAFWWMMARLAGWPGPDS